MSVGMYVCIYKIIKKKIYIYIYEKRSSTGPWHVHNYIISLPLLGFIFGQVDPPKPSWSMANSQVLRRRGSASSPQTSVSVGRLDKQLISTAHIWPVSMIGRKWWTRHFSISISCSFSSSCSCSCCLSCSCSRCCSVSKPASPSFLTMQCKTTTLCSLSGPFIYSASTLVGYFGKPGTLWL